MSRKRVRAKKASGMITTIGRGVQRHVRGRGMKFASSSSVFFLAFCLILTTNARADRFGGSSKLTAIAGEGSGLVELTMTAEELPNPEGVRTALPFATYRVARAVDPSDISDTGATPDGQCPALGSSGPWRPFSDLLIASGGGAGAMHFEAAPPPPTRFVSGVSFDVQFQVIKLNSDGSLDASQELRSECFTVTVK